MKIPKVKEGKRVPVDPCLALFLSYSFSKLYSSEKATTVSDSNIGIVIFYSISAAFDHHTGQKGDFHFIFTGLVKKLHKEKTDMLMVFHKREKKYSFIHHYLV